MRKQRKPVSPLTNFDIHEVSLVDLAANKRRFRIAKRSEPMADGDNTEGTGIAGATAGGEEPNQSQGSVEATVTDVDAGAKATTQLSETVRALQDVVARLVDQNAAPANTDKGETTELIKNVQQRLTRLEKSVGHHTSTTPEPLKPPAQHIWPFDLNSPTPSKGEG